MDFNLFMMNLPSLQIILMKSIFDFLCHSNSNPQNDHIRLNVTFALAPLWEWEWSPVKKKEGGNFYIVWLCWCKTGFVICLWPNRKRNKVQEQLEKNRPYIKKPLNAFMVFMREQRPHIDEEVKRKGNGVVNMHLAQKVGTSAEDCLRLSDLL